MTLRKTWLSSLAVCVAATGATAKPPDFAALENQLSAALARYDSRAVGAMWDDDFVSVFPSGQVARKDERLARMIPPPPAAAGASLTSANDSVEVRYQDDRVAVVLVHSSWRTNPKDAGEAYVATHVWVRRGAQWRLLAAQIASVKP